MKKIMQQIWKMEQRKDKKNDHKGFSLVELIIVIAIMAILVAVLAPQFLQYVSKSRNSTDAQNATAIATALQTYYTTNPTTGSDTITVSSTGTTAGDWSTKALADAGITATSVKCKSTTPWTTYTITWTVKDGKISVTYGATDFANYITNSGTGSST